MHRVPINSAEALVAPFFEPYVDWVKEWRFTRNEAAGAACSTTWGNVNLQWNSPEPAFAVRLESDPDLLCRGYDRLIVHAQLSRTAAITVAARTDRGWRETSFRARLDGMEYALELGEGDRLESLRISVDAAAAGPGWGCINWILLQSSARLPAYEAQWAEYGKDWSWHLNLETDAVSFLPRHEILFSREELRALQARPEFRDPAAPIGRLADHALTLRPEAWIAETVNLGFDLRFARDRDNMKFLVGHGDAAVRHGDQVGQLSAYPAHLALVAAVRRDLAMARHAARFVASILMCPQWHQSFQCVAPGIGWDHRSYTQSLIAFNIVTVVDLFSELFTPLSHEVILRRLAIDVIGQINWTTYKWDYIFANNSLHLFTVGRMAAAIHLTKTLPRAAGEIDQAYADAAANLDRLILPDGGYDEGPGYLNEMLRAYLMAMHLYARARNQPFEAGLHPSLFTINDYVEAVASTDENRYFMPLCDGARSDQEIFDHFGLMARLMPDSVWTRLYAKYRAQTRGLPTEVFDFLGAPDPRSVAPYSLRPFVELPHTGYCASLRELGGEWLKLLILGSKAQAGHAHDDIGSFLLEFAGDTFADDAGMSNYSHPDVALFKSSRYHNMLIPVGVPDLLRRGPVDRPTSPVRGRGDATRLEAEIAPQSRHPAFVRWHRRWRSETPSRLEITDTYALAEGSGVEFLWNTFLPLTAEGNRITIQGRRGRVRLTIPGEGRVALRELPHYSGRPLHQVAVHQPGREGTLTVSVSFLTPDDP